MASKLLEHFRAMQEMTSRYLRPEPYTSQMPGSTPVTAEDADGSRQLFLLDLIQMLDGPEQQEAEAEAEARDKEDVDHEAWRMDIRKQVEQADAIASKARGELVAMEKRNAALHEENNELRSLLMLRELDYAKMMGYVEGKRDSEPPRTLTTTEAREPFYAAMPDGTTTARVHGFYDGGFAGKPAKEWYQR